MRLDTCALLSVPVNKGLDKAVFVQAIAVCGDWSVTPTDILSEIVTSKTGKRYRRSCVGRYVITHNITGLKVPGPALSANVAVKIVGRLRDVKVAESIADTATLLCQAFEGLAPCEHLRAYTKNKTNWNHSNFVEIVNTLVASN